MLKKSFDNENPVECDKLSDYGKPFDNEKSIEWDKLIEDEKPFDNENPVECDKLIDDEKSLALKNCWSLKVVMSMKINIKKV
jgi:hypothetical protein